MPSRKLTSGFAPTSDATELVGANVHAACVVAVAAELSTLIGVTERKVPVRQTTTVAVG